MTKANDRALVKETKALIAEVEAGSTDRAAWIAIQDRVKRLAADRTQREVGELVGKSKDWVRLVVVWAGDADSLPFSRARQGVARDKYDAKKALRDPKVLPQVIGDLTRPERVKVLDTIHEQEAEEAAKEKGIQRGVRRNQDRTFEEMARKQVEKAFDGLAARTRYYGDVPLNASEEQHLRWIKQMVESLLRGADMDDELKEMLDEATAK